MYLSKGMTKFALALCASLISLPVLATNIDVAGGNSSNWTGISDRHTTNNGLPAGGNCDFDGGNNGAAVGDANIPAGSDAFDLASMIWVDSTQLGGNLTQSSQTVTFASQLVSGLNTQVRYEILTTHAILRHYTTFQNPTDSSITVSVDFANNFGSDGSTAIRGTSSGDLVFTTADRWSVTSDSSDSDPVNTTVFFGPGFPAVTPSSVGETVFQCAGPQGNIATYSLTVPPGQTRALMFFHELSDTRANALVNAAIFDDVSGDSDLLVNLTGPELLQTANWDFGTLYGSTKDGFIFIVDENTGAGTSVGVLTDPGCGLPLPGGDGDGDIGVGITEIEFDPATGRAFAQHSDGSFCGHEFDLFTGTSFGPAIPNGGAHNGIEVVNGVWFAAVIFGSQGPSSLHTLDPFTGTSTPIGLTGFGPISGLAYDIFDEIMYGIAGGPGPAMLYTIDLGSGAATPVGPTSMQAGSLQFGADGRLYAGGTGPDSGLIYIINPGTGESQLLGPITEGELFPVTGLTLGAVGGGTQNADLNLDKIDSSDPTLSGAGLELVYTITVTNNGPNDAQNVVVTDILPEGAVFSETSGCLNDPDGVPDCQLGTVANGESVSYDIVVELTRADTVISNTATVTSSTADRDGGNNSATETTALAPADIPVNNPLALMLMALLLGGLGWLALRRT